MKSIEKNKRTLNVPLTGRLASVGAPKHTKILSNPELHLSRDPSNPAIKKNLRLKKNTEALTAKQLNEHLDVYISNPKDLPQNNQQLMKINSKKKLKKVKLRKIHDYDADENASEKTYKV